MIKAIILLISAICISNINALSTGECGKVPIIKDFDASKVSLILKLKKKLIWK